MRRCHQAPERALLPVSSEGIIDALPCRRGTPRRKIRRRRILRAILPQRIRRHSKQEKTLVTSHARVLFHICSEASLGMSREASLLKNGHQSPFPTSEAHHRELR